MTRDSTDWKQRESKQEAGKAVIPQSPLPVIYFLLQGSKAFKV